MSKTILTKKDIAKLFEGKDDITLEALSDFAFSLGYLVRIDFYQKPTDVPESSDDNRQ